MPFNLNYFLNFKRNNPDESIHHQSLIDHQLVISPCTAPYYLLKQFAGFYHPDSVAQTMGFQDLSEDNILSILSFCDISTVLALGSVSRMIVTFCLKTQWYARRTNISAV